MEERVPAPEPTAAGHEQIRVLLFSSAPAAEHRCLGDTDGFDLTVCHDIGAAVELLRTSAFDVVIVDAAGTRDPAELEALRGPAALILTDEYDRDLGRLLERFGRSACLLPADASGAVRAQLVRTAAERARLEAALRQRVHELEHSRAHFRDVIERNADAILVVDTAGVIRFANPMAARLFRSDRSSLAGTEFGFPVVHGETTELDLLGQGETRVVEMRVVESEWEGEVAYIASLRDITERKRAEESALRLTRAQAARSAAESAAERFRFLAEAGTLLTTPLDYTETLATLARLCAGRLADWAVVYAVDDSGAVQRVEVAHRDPALAATAARLRDYPLDPAGGHPVLDVLRTRQPLLIREVDDARLASLVQDERHLELTRQLGVTSLVLVPLVARDRELGALALVSSDPQRRFSEDDVTMAGDLAARAALAIDNSRLYLAANRANQAKTDLLAVISHDLRTPLNAIIGYAELLSMGIPDPLSDGARQRVDRIRVSASHLLYLIDELLSFARLDGGHDTLSITAVDACAVVTDAATVIEPLASERGLDLDVQLPATALTIDCDADRLRQILLNLLGNAVKYTEQGSVAISLQEQGDDVMFVVRDTGVGISPGDHERIFEPFWQVARAGTGVRGTGLGLSVVRRLATMLGGTVSLDSAVGRGTTFTVRLPRRHHDAAGPHGRPPSAPGPNGDADRHR
jgi:signal transduction histidine kinase/PAS domain-containing protein